jgi:hypothetical protein
MARKVRSKYAIPPEQMADNLIALYRRCTPAEKRAGARWYADARDWAREVAERQGVGFPTVAAVTAILSPRNKWSRNKEDAENVIQAFKAGGARAAMAVSTCTFTFNRKRAVECLKTGRPEMVEASRKVAAFYRCILTGGDTDAVCVDVHAMGAAHGVAYTSESQPRLTDQCYREVQQAFRIAAGRLRGRYSAAELQAVLWEHWKRVKRGVGR